MIALVYAVSRNGCIGAQGGLPWHVPSDLAHFKAVTMGKPIIMGRKTWESLPRKPLPGRRNIILTRDMRFKAEGAETESDFARVQALLKGVPEACVIGGAEVFKLALPVARRIYLTRILAEVEGDTFMPPIDEGQWRVVSTRPAQKGEKDSAAFETLVYERR